MPATKRRRSSPRDDAQGAERILGRINAVFRIPLNEGAGCAGRATVTVTPWYLRNFLSERLAREFSASGSLGADRALLEWAADTVKDDATYFLLHIDAPRLLAIAFDAAAEIAVRRAVDNLSARTPEGLSEAEAEAWRAISSKVVPQHVARDVIAGQVKRRILDYLEEMKGKPGRPEGLRPLKAGDARLVIAYREALEKNGGTRAADACRRLAKTGHGRDAEAVRKKLKRLEPKIAGLSADQLRAIADENSR